MRIAIIGTGRVGLVTGVSLASLGHDVVGADAARRRLSRSAKVDAPSTSRGSTSCCRSSWMPGRLSFTAAADEALADADVVFICVGRPVTTGGDSA